MNEDKVERHVRAYFERSYRAPAPGFGARMRSDLATAPRAATLPGWALGLVAVILALATVLALTLPRLLSVAPIPGNRAQRVIPWLSLPAQLEAPVVPSPTPSPLPSGIRACTSAQVQMNALGSGGAGGHVFQSFGFSGRGPGSCFLQGTPAVAIFDSSGRLLRFKTREPFLPADGTGPVLVKPGPLPDMNSETGLTLGQASVTIEWISQPEACPVGSPRVHIDVAKITFSAEGAALTAHVPARPDAYICAGLGIGTFQGPVPPVVEPPLLPLPSVALHAPSTARAGGDLVYEVTLTNERSVSIDLTTNCPDYGQEIFEGEVAGGPPRGIKSLFQLNCGPAGTIQPGQRLTFEIRLALPRDTAPGTYSLFFTLGYPWNEMTTPTSARLTVSA
ncbi:MAG TPA: hypothetical protein VIP57_07630 [Candidatus Dormibacteraeota bacterium]